jgi:predicted esterase
MIHKSSLALLLLYCRPSFAEFAPAGISSQSFAKSEATRAIQDPFRLPLFVASLASESNVVRLGMSVIAGTKPELAKALKPAEPIILGDYEALEMDADFTKLPSMLPGTPESQKLKNRWHYFMYVPGGIRKGQKLPVVVFLHGFGGNFKIFPWWWKGVCEKNKWLMIFPTFGMGFWNNSGEKELVSGAIADALSKSGVQPSSLHLIGLSNGTIGAAPLTNRGLKSDGLIFISGAGHLTPTGLKQVKHCLFVVGTKDPAFHIAERSHQALKKGGLKTTLMKYEGDGHFLLASKRRRAQEDIVKWMNGRLP